MSKETIETIIQENINVKKDFLNSKSEIEILKDIILLVNDTLEKGNKILFAGNGGSAADAQHIAAELVGKFEKIRIPLPAIALTTDTSIMTAVGNDFDFSQIFERQIEALGQEGDIFFGLTTSGNSKNIINAFISAKDRKIKTIALTSKGENEITKIADYSIRVPSNSTARIQECHIMIMHIICYFVDKNFST